MSSFKDKRLTSDSLQAHQKRFHCSDKEYFCPEPGCQVVKEHFIKLGFIDYHYKWPSYIIGLSEKIKLFNHGKLYESYVALLVVIKYNLLGR